MPTLEVLLVPPGPDDPQENADAAYIAQRTQQGKGTGTEARRASLPEARDEQLPPPDAAQIDPDKRNRPDEPEGAVSVLARRALEAERLATGVEPRAEAPVFFAVPTPAVPTVGLNAAVADRELYLRGERAADGKLLADTRESAIATYLDGWKRRIERVGTINFPNEARRRQLSGNPVVEVAIRANGTLETVIVRRTSGHAELDNAAVGIVRLAAPFEPFPSALRERYPGAPLCLRMAVHQRPARGRRHGLLLRPIARYCHAVSAYLTNQFLIAMPAMDDPNFAQTVTLVCEHNERGALGIVINRTLPMTLGEVLRPARPRLQPLARRRAGRAAAAARCRRERGFVLHRRRATTNPRCRFRDACTSPPRATSSTRSRGRRARDRP